jgi:hypothetical protein
MMASCLISSQIAKCMEPFSIGEELMAACNEVIGQSAASTVRDISWPNDTTERRTSERAGDTGTDLIEENERWKLFTIELEEFTDILNNSILLTYV